jgi:hypothetical protein
MSTIDERREQDDENLLEFNLSDDAIERAAEGKAIAANPTLPSAIICVPL